MNKLYLLGLSLLFFVACDILSTRDPEIPDLPSTSLQPATTPNILFENLVTSFSQKVTDNYLGCLADSSLIASSFSFTPSVGASNLYSVFNEWNRDYERRYFNNLKNLVVENEPITLLLNNESSNILGDSAIFQFDYLITLKLKSLQQETFKGNAQFKIKIDRNNIWVICEWIDISSQNSQSWSDLKGRYYL